MKHLIVCLVTLWAAFFQKAMAQDLPNIITAQKSPGAFALAEGGATASIVVEAGADSLLHKVAGLFRDDVERVTGQRPGINTTSGSAKNIVLVGEISHSALLQQLVKAGKLSIAGLKGKWEGYRIQVVKAPFKGVDQALVVAGSDRRGAAYGLLELSRQMGVSPWYWWADVPVQRKSALYIKAGTVLADAPGVKYRGFFINDEAPALSSWSKEKFGGFNHRFYEKVFELLLRLKGNYLWPAMWGNAFNADDTLNPVLAHRWGIVMGTSHHEPMVRSQQEWKRFGKGAWNYEENKAVLQDFWKKGIENSRGHESIATIGMRGDGDEPMTEGTATALLERIVADQRKIISDVTGKPAAQTPQLWALYKEVQDYYDKGMRVPDDVTLLLCDDNWGNIRKLPKLNEKPRSGGYGIYYHFDYVGGPRNYKWLNTNNIARVWEQMHLAWEYHARQIWIVNVGDIKPMEFPLSFFLDQAWAPQKWNPNNLRTYYTRWAESQFGAPQAGEIGDLLRLYGQYSARRKPELLDARTYNAEEWDRVVAEWNALLGRAEAVNAALPAAARDAFFQLVLHPVKALANLHELYRAVATNRRLADRGDARANAFADKAKHFYAADSLITLEYHRLAGGKWNHMMSQTHIGYTYWQQPPFQKMPEVAYVPQGATAREAAKTEVVYQTAEHLVPATAKGSVFYEQEGYVSLEAEHYTRAVPAGGLSWKVIPDIGRTGSAITTFPVTAPDQQPGKGARLEYDFYTYDTGRVVLQAFFSPTLNFPGGDGLKYAVSLDGEAPQVITLNKDDNDGRAWGSWVSDNIIRKRSEHRLRTPGRHTLTYWPVSPAVLLQKVVLDLGGLQPSYLGPQETRRQ
ncbi:glycosyl hydrolase 115 family protein [Paraflavisolibacter sp. H34]|uniref:glycosyl hydrolase 115 family protein n=1 Tax=Huijunlia imazamoxiresistens TaxID=3127457 RepID=UPI00301957C8